MKLDVESMGKIADNIYGALYAVELLEKVYIEVGPYRSGDLSQETMGKINDFFGFDDSE